MGVGGERAFSIFNKFRVLMFGSEAGRVWLGFFRSYTGFYFFYLFCI